MRPRRITGAPISIRKWVLPPHALFALVAAGVMTAVAHDPGLSTARVTVHGDFVEVRVTIAAGDLGQVVALDGDGDGKVSREEFVSGEARVAEAFQTKCAVTSRDGTARSPWVRVSLDDSENISALLRFAGESALSFSAGYLKTLPTAHREFVQVFSQGDAPISEKLLTPGDYSMNLAVEDKKPAVSPVRREPSLNRLRWMTWAGFILLASAASALLLQHPRMAKPARRKELEDPVGK